MSIWEEKSLNELGILARGKSRHRPRNAEFLYWGKYPFVQTSDVKNANFYLNEYTQTYSEEGLKQSKLWKKGTLCITIAANIADTAILGIDACFPDSILGFTPFNNVSDVKFVKYCFDILQRKIKQISQGAAQDNLSMEKLNTVKFLVPEYSTQFRIASILCAYDDLIENNIKRIKLLEEIAQRTYEEWFMKFRINGVKLLMDEKTGLPVGWEILKLSDVCTRIQSGGTPSRSKNSYWKNGTMNWFKTKELRDSWLIDSEEKISIDALNNSSAKTFPPNTILMAIYASPTLGRLGLLLKESSCNQAAIGFICKKGTVTFQWLYYKLFELRDRFNGIARGAGQQNISGELVKDQTIVLPKYEMIKEFTDFVSPIIFQQLSLQKENLKLKESRDILLPKLMNGIINVE